MLRFALIAILITLLPSTVSADRQGVIGSPLDDVDESTGNPYVRGIASHAWWLDPEVYGDQLFEALDDLQVTTVRLTIDWRRFEPQQDVWEWGLYDRVLGELAKRNIVIVADFNTIPAWASVDYEGCLDPVTEITSCQLREDKYWAFERAIEAALTRYTWIRHWEFWNEPEMWRYLGEDGPTYLRNLRTFYDVAHRVNPEIVVAAQTLVGTEYMEYIYNLSDEEYGVGNQPWDAISIHPYNWWYVPVDGEPPLEINYDRIYALRNLMVQRGDAAKMIWVTEFGWTNEEIYQTRNLPVALDWLQAQPYIQFAHLHMLHDWNTEPPDQFGLMRIVPDENGWVGLDEDTVFEPKELYYFAFKNYPTDRYGRRPDGPNILAFEETGHAISGRFLDAWQERGGIERIGLPLTRPYPRQQPDGSWLLVQDFERARLEYHPEFEGTPAVVINAQIGREMTEDRSTELSFIPLDDCVATADRHCFDGTGHSLSAGFRVFWEANDGLVSFGLPISEEFVEHGRTVQYFERVRLEWWPELGPGADIVIAPLVREQLVAAGWLGDNGLVPAGADVRLPSRREFP